MIKIIERKRSFDGSVKYAFANRNGDEFEAVYFRLSSPYVGYCICLSSQAGCAMGCKFCATAYGGFFANLTSGEMIEQISLIVQDLVENNLELQTTKYNIALMGMGEPFMNYANVVEFCQEGKKQLKGLNKITLATVGVTDRIYQFADDINPVNVKLFLSVHSPYSHERENIMPITKKYSLESAIKACKTFAKKTNTFVKAIYVLLNGINDTKQHAKDLAKILDPRYFEIQIQSYNPTPGIPYKGVGSDMVSIFRDIVAKTGINAEVYDSGVGNDVGGGCGQFLRKVNGNKKHA